MARAIRFRHNPGNEAFTYYRYSSSSQREASIEEQKIAAHKYAEEHGLIIVKEFQDAAMSGTDDERPGFQDMLWTAEHLHPAYLILWKSDRLARDRYDAVGAKERLRDAGVLIEYVAEPLPEDEAERQLIEGFKEVIDENFILTHRRNVMRGLDYNAGKCLYNGRKLLGYKGTTDHPYEIDPETAPIVQKLFRDYIDGKPMQQIKTELENAGVRSVKGNVITINSIRSILHNEAYLGIYRWGNHRIEGGMPRLITDEEFKAAQDRLNANKRGGRPVEKPDNEDTNRDFWLVGKVFCGLCEQPMHGMSGTGKSGRKFYYYTCVGRTKHQCDKKNIQKDLLEGIVADVIDEILNNPTASLTIAHVCYTYYMRQNDDTRLLGQEIDNRLKVIDKKLGNFVKAIEDGIWNEDTQKRMEQLQAEKAALKSEKEAWELRQKYDLKESDVLKFLRSFTGQAMHDTLGRARLLELLVQKVVVYDDHVDVICRFIDGPRTVTFDDYKNSKDDPLTYLAHDGREIPAEDDSSKDAENASDKGSSSSRTSPLKREAANTSLKGVAGISLRAFGEYFCLAVPIPEEEKMWPSYADVKSWVYDNYGLRVTKTCIASVKHKEGMPMLKRKTKPRQYAPQPETVKKEKAVKAAFEYFGVI